MATMVNGFQFCLINNINQYAFGYSDPRGLFNYYISTVLPSGVNPKTNLSKAILYLMKKFIATRDPDIHKAIGHLNSSMQKWEYQHFVNYCGKQDDAEYSSDSDEDDRDLKCFNDQDSKLAEDILSRTRESSERDSLGKRLKTLIVKTGSKGISANSIKKFTDDRRGYFPSLNTPVTMVRLWANQLTEAQLMQYVTRTDTLFLESLNKSQIIIRGTLHGDPVHHVLQDELLFINTAVQNKTLSIKTVPKAGGKPQIEISGKYRGKEIHYVLQRQYFLPFARGISYLVDRFGRQGRKTHRRAPKGESFMNYAEANVKTIPNFYNCSDYSTVDTKVLHENARILKKTLIDFKRKPATILKNAEGSRQFDNFLDYLQHAFSNGIVSFIKHLEEFNKQFPGLLPNNGTPLLPFSHMTFHAVRYACGEKDPYEDFAMPALWDSNGRAIKPHIGKLVVNIHPLSDCLGFDEPNVVPYLTNFGLSTTKVIGAEYEVSFLSFVPKERNFNEYMVRYPSFHRGYQPKFLAKYGLDAPLFNEFRVRILDPRTQVQAARVLKAWLCLFYSIKIMEDVARAIAKQGTMIFFHPDGSFQYQYPAEGYQANTAAVNFSKKLGADNLPKAEHILTDNGSWSDKRSLSYVPDSFKTPPRPPLSRAKLTRSASLGSENSKDSPYSPASPEDVSKELEDVHWQLGELSFDVADEQQLGWNCFDIAVGLKDRQALVHFALNGGEGFQHLLAPEIANAVAITAIYMNRAQAQTEVAKKEMAERNKKLQEFFEISAALEGNLEQEQVVCAVETLMMEEHKIDRELEAMKPYTLPAAMHTREIQQIVNDYYDAYEKMTEAVRDCNVSLGFPEGQRKSLEELDHFFSEKVNNERHEIAYNQYMTKRNTLLKPFEDRFNAYCLDRKVFAEYIQSYYGANQWFAFQRRFGERNQTSMVDIVARMLNCKIVIHSNEEGQPIIYSTDLPSSKEIHIVFLGNNHFKKLRHIEHLGSSLEERWLALDTSFQNENRSNIGDMTVSDRVLVQQFNAAQQQVVVREAVGNSATPKFQKHI